MKPVEILISIVISAVTAGIVVYVMIDKSVPEHKHSIIEQKIADLEQKNTNLEKKIADLERDLPGMVQQKVKDAIANLDIVALVKPQIDQAIDDMKRRIDKLVEQEVAAEVADQIAAHNCESKKWRKCVTDGLADNPDVFPNCPFQGDKCP